jgi:hypothetical protein
VEWLVQDQQGASVLATARQLLALEEAIAGCLPARLAEQCKMVRLDRQRLTVAVPGSGHAAKLRQLTPTLIRHLTSQGWNVSEIMIRIQADLLHSEAKTSTRDVQPLDVKALDAFSELRRSVPAGPLADAIGRLLARHRK